MIKIKFSHYYKKMPDNYMNSILLEVIPVNLEDISYDFIEYDTKIAFEDEYYKLPSKGRYMILILQEYEMRGIHEKYKWRGSIWTTIRRWTPEKEDYYRSHLGEEVKIEVKE